MYGQCFAHGHPPEIGHSDPKLENPAMNKLLLTSVVGPFGVDDAFGRKDNKMELMHNRV